MFLVFLPNAFKYYAKKLLLLTNSFFELRID